MRPLSMRHYLGSLERDSAELRELARRALALKREGWSAQGSPLAARVFGLLFFNPSVRTRVSCESAMARLGGSSVALHPGADTWRFEERDGVVMDGATQEHVRELAPVLSRMCDVVGIRKAELISSGAPTAAGASWAELARDDFLRAFVRHAEVPVVNLESNFEHPCQGLADMATLIERLREPRGAKYVLTWAWHPKALPVATPHSQLLAACDLGMRAVLLRPEGYDLDPGVLAQARRRAEASGGSLELTDDVEAAYSGARVVCAKSWGRIDRYGRPAEEARPELGLRPRWIVDEQKLARGDDAFFMHCLPVRRNVIVTDGVLDSRRSAVIDEAENRLWTAGAILLDLLGARPRA